MGKYKPFPCELHCHTLHSDGKFTVEELMKTAKERALKGICLTDHNTTSGWEETEKYPAPAVLKGIEWTTYFGHMLVLGSKEYVDWRDAVPDNIDEKMLEVKKQGGLVGIAHPYQLGTPICTGGHWDYKVQDWSLVDYIEVWSEGCPYLNTANKRAISLWHCLLDRGYKIAPTFGRDWHSAEGDEIPTACTYLLCEGESLTAERMRAAIKSGKTAVCAGAAFYFEAEGGETLGDTVPAGEITLRFITDKTRNPDLKPKEIRLITNGSSEALRIPYAERAKAKVTVLKNHWYSAELWAEDESLIALTAPIYGE